MLSSVLWGVVALLVLLWLLGWLVGNAGSLIHLLLEQRALTVFLVFSLI